MGIQDLIVAPLIFLFIMIFGLMQRNKMKDKTIGSYFLKGLFLKLLGALGIYLIYYAYYGTGDTIFYFKRAMTIDSVLLEDLTLGLKLLFNNPRVIDGETYSYFQGMRAFDMSSFLVVRMAAISNIICFNSYLANAFIFSALSYIGIWRLFRMLQDNFPDKIQIIAWSLLFIPSVFFWGSGVMKDNVTFGFLGILVSSFYYIFFKRQAMIKNLFLMLVSILVIGTIKSYILIALIPSLFAWIFFHFRGNIQSSFIKTISTPVLLVLLAGGGYLALDLLGDSFSKFSIENAQERAEDMQRWHSYRVEVLKSGEGSAYSLGEVNFTPLGILQKIPAAVNVALFRPYLWEAGNIVGLLAAFESFVLLLITLRMIGLFLTKQRAGLAYINSHAILIFMFIFTFIFAFSVGFTSYNFGALSRYRIPFLPFYVCAVLIITDNLKNYKRAL